MIRGPMVGVKLEAMFALYIELGNDAMCSPEDVATALEDVARKVRRGETEGFIDDSDGQIVGEFEQHGP